jgi:hypothetical protein
MPDRMEYQITLQKDGRFDTYESAGTKPTQICLFRIKDRVACKGSWSIRSLV